MNLNEFQLKLSLLTDHNKAIYALIRGLKAEKQVILDMNKDQLFNDHIGADNVVVGYYSFNAYNEERRGEPYTMVDTGLFKKGMRIDFYYRHITIRSEYHSYEMQTNSNAKWRTTEWFGLTQENYAILREDYVKPIILAWMKGVLSGNLTSAGTVKSPFKND